MDYVHENECLTLTDLVGTRRWPTASFTFLLNHKVARQRGTKLGTYVSPHLDSQQPNLISAEEASFQMTSTKAEDLDDHAAPSPFVPAFLIKPNQDVRSGLEIPIVSTSTVTAQCRCSSQLEMTLLRSGAPSSLLTFHHMFAGFYVYAGASRKLGRKRVWEFFHILIEITNLHLLI